MKTNSTQLEKADIKNRIGINITFNHPRLGETVWSAEQDWIDKYSFQQWSTGSTEIADSTKSDIIKSIRTIFRLYEILKVETNDGDFKKLIKEISI